MISISNEYQFALLVINVGLVYSNCGRVVRLRLPLLEELLGVYRNCI